MEPQKLKKLADLFGRDLAGWRIAQCHFLELKHGLMGTFPAVYGESKEIIAVLDKSLLQKVWQHLERRPATVTSFMVVVHPESGVAFGLESYPASMGDAEPLRVLSSEAINELCRKTDSFQWARGLIQTSKEAVHDPVFT